MPDLVGRPVFAATQALADAGFVPKPPQLEYSGETKGTVLRQDPAPRSRVKAESPATLVVSQGPPPVPVPDVHGLSYGEAATQLAALHLQPRSKPVFSDTVPKGEVIRTNPAALRKAPYDSIVNVYVSKGPDLVAVPNVIGMTVETAQPKLEARGFAVEVKRFRPGRKVGDQSPLPDEKARRGSTVTLILR
jgi:serine/threonine-protein kinase